MRLILYALVGIALFYVVRKMLAAARPEMSRSEAAKLLGVGEDATTDEIIEAHRRLIAKVHPDAGGNAELAARVNRARDVLLRSISN
jgi:DnaJ homolog subfamily C member 19